MRKNIFYIFVLAPVIVLMGCAPMHRQGMVTDPATGLQFGSIIQKNIVIDASQFENKKLKLRIRNTSGDPAFNFYGFSSALKNAYRRKGYTITSGDDYGVLIDVNVTYSGQLQQRLTSEFGFLGAVAGGITGGAVARDPVLGSVAGVAAGATLGSILGSYVTEDTYIVVAYVSLGLVEPEEGKEKTTIVFSSSNTKEEKERTGFKPFRQRINTGIAVFAGGRNVFQSDIAQQVRQRFKRIISDVI